jgi:hypothetical protein
MLKINQSIQLIRTTQAAFKGDYESHWTTDSFLPQV